MISISDLRAVLSPAVIDDEELLGIKEEVEELFNSTTGLNYSEGSFSSDYSLVDGQKKISLDQRPIKSVDSVEYSLDGITWNTLSSEYYGIINEFILVLTESVNTSYVRVSVTSGYGEDTPSVIKRALKLQARFMQKRLGNGAIAIASQSFEGGAGTYLAPTLHPYFSTVCNKYKRYFG